MDDKQALVDILDRHAKNVSLEVADNANMAELEDELRSSCVVGLDCVL